MTRHFPFQSECNQKRVTLFPFCTAFSAVEMLWFQAISLVTIVYCSKSSGKFLASLNVCDVYLEGHTREISRSVVFDLTCVA